MRVQTDFTHNYPEDPVRNLDFRRYGRPDGPLTLHLGYGAAMAAPSPPGRHALLSLEDPSSFVSFELDPATYGSRFEKIFTLCPFTAAWCGNRWCGNRWQSVFFPTSYWPDCQEKSFDVIYTGQFHGPLVEQLVEAIIPFRRCVVSFADRPEVTHRDVSYRDKMLLVARSRVAVVHNLLFFGPHHRDRLLCWPGIETHEAFRHVFGPEGPWPRMVPQLKSRLFEAAFCRALILCRRDPWNLVEQYFCPDTEFVYYDDEASLPAQLADILAHWGRYEPVVDAAFHRAEAHYSAEAFYRRYLEPLDT